MNPAALAFALVLAQETRPKVDPAITREDLAACVAVLASDELRGRATGTPECEKAAEFLASRLALAGVKPAGDDGTFLQRVPLTNTHHKAIPKLTVWRADGTSTAAVCGVDFDWRGGTFSNAKLTVRVLAKAEDMPSKADATLALFVDGSSKVQREVLGESGGRGCGVLLTAGRAVAGKQADDRPPRDRREVADPSRPAPIPSLRINGPLLEQLRKGEVTALRVETDVVVEEVRTFNVLGRIDGVGTPSNAALAQDAIMFSAHYDHLAPRAGADGEDTIFNGADDDASGCSAVLELAEAFAAGAKPARTLLFLFATGEEIGLVGSNWFVDHPVVPLERLVCDLNFEMIGRPDALVGGAGKLWLTGYERSNLGASFAALGMSVVADPRPTQGFFQRSDNYALALRGVVAQTLSTYNLHDDYHHVSDELDTLDFAHMEACVRAAFIGAGALADGSLAPQWNEGGQPKR